MKLTGSFKISSINDPLAKSNGGNIRMNMNVFITVESYCLLS